MGEEETETPSYLTDGPSALPDVVNDPIKAPAKPQAVSALLAVVQLPKLMNPLDRMRQCGHHNINEVKKCIVLYIMKGNVTSRFQMPVNQLPCLEFWHDL